MLRYAILIISLLIIGIPHGAIDHLIAARLVSYDAGNKFWIFFYSLYLLAVIVIGIIWITIPKIGFILFLLMTLYHFGQADMAAISRNSSNLILPPSRGVFIIILILFTHPNSIAGIIEAASTISINQTSVFTHYNTVVLTLGIIQYMLVLCWYWYLNYDFKLQRYITDALLLCALFLASDPVIAFAVYFMLWHGIGHVEEMRSFFASHDEPMQWSRFYKKALPFSLLSWVGLALVYGVSIYFELTSQWIPLIFILISALTLPHLVVVEKMHAYDR